MVQQQKAKIISKGNESTLRLVTAEGNALQQPVQYALYTIVLIEKGSGEYSADFGTFPFKAPVLLFSTPLQTLVLEGNTPTMAMLQFHGDFYCIEYHKKEVACNGVLFNNIYTDPTIPLNAEEHAFFQRLITDVDTELSAPEPDRAVLTAYLQLFLAKATAIKTRSQKSPEIVHDRDETMETFRTLVEENFLTLRRPAEYAELLHIAPDTLTKRCKRYFKKTPTELIQERIVLEAKKGLHLTRKSVKEIAQDLKFRDEHYFSRFFKKNTKVSPLAFREMTGISIVANLSSSDPESSIPNAHVDR